MRLSTLVKMTIVCFTVVIGECLTNAVECCVAPTSACQRSPQILILKSTQRSVKAADSQSQSSRPLDEWPMECEGAEARLDFAVIDTRKAEGTYLIVLARLGSGELSDSLNRQRLSVIKEYILRRGTDLKYVLASGSRVKGLGRVELYV